MEHFENIKWKLEHNKVISEQPNHRPLGKRSVLDGYRLPSFMCLFLIFCEPATCVPTWSQDDDT